MSAPEHEDPHETGEDQPRMSPGRARRFFWSMALLALLVNLPLATSVLDAWRLDRSGIEVSAAVVGARTLGETDDPWLSFRFDRELDPDQTLWAAHVEQEVWAEARRTGGVPVRVLPDSPRVHRVEGQVRGYAGLLMTLALDAAMLVIWFLWWRARRRPRHATLADDQPAA